MGALKALLRRWNVSKQGAKRIRKRAKRLFRFRLRWASRRLGRTPPTIDLAQGGYGLERCDVVFINLDSRPDRREEVEKELRRIGVSRFHRFSAIADENGLLGCGRSHREVLESWEPEPGRLLLVMEDDCEFVSSRDEIDAAVEEFARNPWLEGLCLAYRTVWALPISARFLISPAIYTTSCYAVKPSVVDRLSRTINEGNQRLAAGEPAKKAACDVVWHNVHRYHFFALPKERLARQRASFSDIQRRWTDYGV